ncbi:MAG TPA: energy-coupling factor transporter transmembrane component T [Candidatus Krumholzibacteriaceae bacterium]|nr:energy-coupling factor transporter transmembrane component T [Candidatus Krumholzibacteriaceae bacterium]
MSLLESLRFTRGDTFIHNMDPRVKFLLTLVSFAASVMFLELVPLIVIFLVQLPLIVAAKVVSEWYKSVKGASVIAVIIFASNMLSFYYFRDRQLTWALVEYSLALTVRFITLITSFSVFFLTTSPDKLSLALEKARIPYEFNFAFITAIRFVPVLADEAQTIMDAQRSRGLELDKGNFITRVRNYIPILLPLIINSIRRSLELAEAMESRAFGATEDRTNIYELSMRGSDYAVLFIVLLCLGVMVYVKLYLPPFSGLLGEGLII